MSGQHKMRKIHWFLIGSLPTYELRGKIRKSLESNYKSSRMEIEESSISMSNVGKQVHPTYLNMVIDAIDGMKVNIQWDL